MRWQERDILEDLWVFRTSATLGAFDSHCCHVVNANVAVLFYSFMNSCLQCVSNLPALVKYFHPGLYAREINDTSPTKGALATAFGDLIKALRTGDKFTATRPVELKRVIGKTASRFTGYDQQDAQEFLRFLLDGLHEDLNRVRRKPAYYEIKDRPEAKDRDVSDEYWKFYLERNASTLSELFCGQLRSEIGRAHV